MVKEKKKEKTEILGVDLTEDEIRETLEVNKPAKKGEKEEKTIDDLPGVGEKIAEKLRSAGYIDLMAIATTPLRELQDLANLGDVQARKIVQAARKELKMTFMSGEEFMDKRKNVGRISTCSKELDSLIGGGVETQSITEAAGGFGSGKTQLGLQLAVSVQLPVEKGGLNGHAALIDCEGTFRPFRIEQLAKVLKLDPKEVLKKIKVARAYSSDHQMLLAEKVPELVEAGVPIKLLVVDSLTSLFRAEYTGRGTLADRQQKLNRHLHFLQRLADRYNIAVYVTNQVMSRPDIFFGNPDKPIGGHIVGHACLTKDSLIQLADGEIIEIGRLNENKKVLTNDIGNSLKMKRESFDKRFIRFDIKEVFEIDTGNKIKASPLHPFFRLDGFKITEVQAKDIKEGDWLAHANEVNIKGKQQRLPKVEVGGMVTITSYGSKFIKRLLYEKKLSRYEICKKMDIEMRHFRRVLNQNYPTTLGNIQMLSQAISPEVLDYTEVYTSHKHKDIVIPENLSAEFSQILGYVLGDGYLDKRSIEMKDEREEVIEIYKKLFKNVFNVEGRISKVSKKNCFKLNINSKAIKSLFEETVPLIYKFISKSPKPIIKHFIRGFVDAEGYVSKKRAKIVIAQKEDQILKVIQLLLLRFGIRSRLQSSYSKVYTLLVEGRDVPKFYKKIGLSAFDKEKLLEKWAKHYEKTYTKEIIPIKRKVMWDFIKECGLAPSRIMRSRPKHYKHVCLKELTNIVNNLKKLNITNKKLKSKINFLEKLISSDIRFEKVRKIKKLKNKEPLFDLEVPKTKNYIANGFIVHNCTFRMMFRKSKGDRRVARLIDSPCLPEGEAVFRITDEGIRD